MHNTHPLFQMPSWHLRRSPSLEIEGDEFAPSILREGAPQNPRMGFWGEDECYGMEEGVSVK